jgi:hypothetical protein
MISNGLGEMIKNWWGWESPPSSFIDDLVERRASGATTPREANL